MRYNQLVSCFCAALLLLGGIGAVPVSAQNNTIHPTTSSPAALSSFQILPASLIGGKSAIGTVTLTNPAPASGTIITIASNNKAVLPIYSVRIPGGAKTYTFTIRTWTVLNDVNATLYATYLGVTKTASLAIHPKPAVVIGVYPDASEVLGGGGDHIATVALSGNAPGGGAVVTLDCNSFAVSMPTSVIIPAGENSANFTFTPGAVTKDTIFTMTATYNGVTRFAHVIIRAALAQPQTLSLTANDVNSGDTGYCYLTLSHVATSNITVTITCNDPNALSISHSEVIPTGYDNLTLPFHAGTVTHNTLVHIVATINGSSSSTDVTIFANAPVP